MSNPLKPSLSRLYFGRDSGAVRFRFAMLTFDALVILLFIASSLVDELASLYWLDYVFAGLLTLDLSARVYIASRPLRFVLQVTSLADVVVILSLLAAAFVDNLGFLRVLRMLRLLRSYHIVRELRQTFPFFKKNEEIIGSSLNLTVFVFVITAVIYVLEVDKNEHINNYLDALYFTVATLTTTGFGDITLSDTLGRLIAVIIMVFGVGLFLRLVQTIFRPNKVAHSCTVCGLSRHEGDAVHCKHCGNQLNIPTEGDWV
jgi:voltage-gated potassium channel